MARISARLRRAVVRRAANRCEYCGLSQKGQEAEFHVDHVVPVVDGGATKLDNLALACVSCSLRKAARRVAADPHTSELAPLYSPRQDRWPDHFRWEGVTVIGLTPTGRATVAALDLNRPRILEVRGEEAWFGRHPPPLP
jgi:hypothetical protein